jgi:hypothetical protein
MDRLKNFIDDNRERFDDIELPEGHRERFEQKLKAQNRKPIIRYALWSIIAAACVSLFLLIDVQPQSAEEYDLCDIMSTEKQELILYYNMQMNNIISQLEAHNNTASDERLAQAKTIQSECFHFEEEVVPDLPCTEKAIFAINQHYIRSIEGMTTILEQTIKQ